MTLRPEARTRPLAGGTTARTRSIRRASACRAARRAVMTFGNIDHLHNSLERIERRTIIRARWAWRGTFEGEHRPRSAGKQFGSMRTIRSVAIRLRSRPTNEAAVQPQGEKQKDGGERAMVVFKLLVGLCGLTLRETAIFVGAGSDTVRSWSSGRNRCPESVISKLRELTARQERAARRVLHHVARMDTRPETIVLHYPLDDEQAQAIDWPCVNAWSAVAARIIAGTSVRVLLTPAPPSVVASDAVPHLTDAVVRIPLPQSAGTG